MAMSVMRMNTQRKKLQKNGHYLQATIQDDYVTVHMRLLNKDGSCYLDESWQGDDLVEQLGHAMTRYHEKNKD